MPGADGGFQRPHRPLAAEAEVGHEAIGPAQPLIHAAPHEGEVKYLKKKSTNLLN
jgi:hypothetical protein